MHWRSFEQSLNGDGGMFRVYHHVCCEKGLTLFYC